MSAPEGRTRWDLRGAALAATCARTLEIESATVVVTDECSSPGTTATRTQLAYTDPTGGDGATRWLLPDRQRELLQPGARQAIELVEGRGDTTARLRIDVETVGVGWVHLPSGPREVALQRARVVREPMGGAGIEREDLVHRWVDPLAGIAAETTAPESAAGMNRLAASGGMVLQEVLSGAANLNIYVNQLWQGTYKVVNYGWDRGTGTPVSSLTTPSYSTMGDLINASSWDFSPNQSGTEAAQTTTPINASETCNFSYPNDGQHDLVCGYDTVGANLERTDANFTNPSSVDKTNDVAQREDRVSDVTIWIRAGAQHEGLSGGFGSGESRFCYTGTDPNGKVRTQVPLWRFPHQDVNGWYMAIGDSWTSTPFNCEQNLYSEVCGLRTFIGDRLYTAGTSLDSRCHSSDGTGHAGTQSATVLKGGVVTVPSGHTFNAQLVRQAIDFCVYVGSNCTSIFNPPTAEVRTYVYLWQVPYLGSVVFLQSPQTVHDPTSFTTVDLTNINFGLFPPRTITVTGSTQTSVTLSWDPGLDTHRINGYKVYWDTHSGGSGGYSFNSASNPGQVTFNGTSATVSGLQAGATYYLTVTALSNFTDPSSSIVTTYESLLYPTQVYGDPSFVYPVEVQAQTTCIPTSEVQGLTVDKAGGGSIQICWGAVTDPCVTGYQVLGADSPTSDANFSPIADVGLVTCWTGSPTQSYFLVIAKGTGGNGPWGHYGH